MTKQEIGAALREARKAANYTLKEAARLMGRPYQTIGSWEHGQSQPDIDSLFALCKLYGISVSDAFGLPSAPRVAVGGLPVSEAEADIIKAFRALDARGQAAVLDALRGQLRFCDSKKQK